MLIFDTLSYSEKLQAAGFTREQAKVQAEQLKEIVENDLATKEDIKRLELQIAEVREATKEDIKRLELQIEDVRDDIKRLDLQITEVKKDIEEIRADIRDVRKEMAQYQVNVVKWIVGMGLTVIIANTTLMFSFLALFVKG